MKKYKALQTKQKIMKKTLGHEECWKPKRNEDWFREVQPD